LNWSTAACVLPGISEATLMVTELLGEPRAAAVAHAATRPATAAAVAILRRDFIVLSLLDLVGS
jgi:hypothetical protein